VREFGGWVFGLGFGFGLQMEKTHVLSFLIHIFIFEMHLRCGFFLDCFVEDILLGFVCRKAFLFDCLLVGRLLVDMLLE
jgi:hypothetical protein